MNCRSQWTRLQRIGAEFKTATNDLCSLLVGGQSVIDENRKRFGSRTDKVQQQASTSLSKIQQKENKTAREVFDVMEKQAVELSKLAILFSHLVYFKIYRFIDSNDEKTTDMAFKQNINFNLILLTFKKFLRATKNSSITTNSRSTKSGLKITLYSMDNTDFFDMCKQYNVATNFEQWSQNAWNYIADTFKINFENNVMVHLHQRLRKWFYFRLRNGRKKNICAEKKIRKGGAIKCTTL